MIQIQASHRSGANWRPANWRVALFGAALAAALALPAGVSRADPLENAPDVQFFRSLLEGIGLKKDGTGDINYRERSPLVVPADSSLPPPQTATPAQLDPAWPTDQAARRARAEAAADAKRQNMSEDEEARALRPDELNPRGRRASRSTVSDGAIQDPREAARPLPPSALGISSIGSLFGKVFSTDDKPESKPFSSEPPRTALTEPPPGYQTPSPSQPYGIGKGDSLIETQKPMNPMDLPARGD